MEIPTYILFLLGCLGAADIVLFHSVAHGIRSHPDSAKELVTHSLRGPTYAALFVLIPNFALKGLFSWGLLALFVFDVGISIWDFWLEQSSRRFLGGLPSGEYVLHMLIATVFGGFVASFIYFAGDWFGAATSLAYAPAAVPGVLRLAMLTMAVLVLASGAQDAVAALRLRRMSRDPRIRRRDEAHFFRTEFNPLDVGSCTSSQPRRWMRLVLIAAGSYNLGWGTWVVLFPSALFRWNGMPPMNFPQIWQCVGMLVGVYGAGYLIAARDPFRHWPIVFIGLLGKLLGPAGMLWSVVNHDLSAGFAWTCLTNDVIWWVPFLFILVRVSNNRREQVGCRSRSGHSSRLTP